MKIFSLRFGENIAPPEGTVAAHLKVIDDLGYCWYGKFGNPISSQKIEEWFSEPEQKVLLIHSGSTNRYWMNVIGYQRDVPCDIEAIPSYYRDIKDKVKCWFKVNSIVCADRDVVSKCILISSKAPLSEASKVSMNPCMFVEFNSEG